MSDEKKNVKSPTKSNESALARRKARRKNRGESASADWGEANPDLLQQLIAIVTSLGGTCTFGYTRDGGAYYVNYYIDGESIKEYIRPTEDIDESIRGEIESWK